MHIKQVLHYVLIALLVAIIVMQVMHLVERHSEKSEETYYIVPGYAENMKKLKTSMDRMTKKAKMASEKVVDVVANVLPRVYMDLQEAGVDLQQIDRDVDQIGETILALFENAGLVVSRVNGMEEVVDMGNGVSYVKVIPGGIYVGTSLGTSNTVSRSELTRACIEFAKEHSNSDILEMTKDTQYLINDLITKFWAPKINALGNYFANPTPTAFDVEKMSAPEFNMKGIAQMLNANPLLHRHVHLMLVQMLQKYHQNPDQFMNLGTKLAKMAQNYKNVFTSDVAGASFRNLKDVALWGFYMIYMGGMVPSREFLKQLVDQRNAAARSK